MIPRFDRAWRAFLTLGVAVALLAPVSTQGPRLPGSAPVAGGRLAAANTVLVKYGPRTSDTDRDQLNVQIDADNDHPVGGAGVRRLHSRTFDADTLVRFLRLDPRVVYAEPDFVVQAVATPNDPQFGNLWGLLNTGQTIGCGGSCYGGATGVAGASIGAVSAWDVSTGSRANVVGIVDTGIDYTHPDLAANIWSAPTSFTVTIANHQITCAAGTHGFKSLNSSQTLSCDPMDDNNHGTHVSGTIGGVGNNGVGVAGLNWTASLMGLKFLDSTGSGYTSDAVNAIEFAIQAKAQFGANANVRVLSNSWGGGGASQALLDEINKAGTNDMLFVAAAGNNHANNNTTAFYPASYAAANIVAVAATTNTDTLASFSNYGSTTVHLGAPGQDVLSTIRNNSYAYFSGTSMATPHVSGAAALLLSVCSLNTASLKSTLMGNVDATLAGLVISGGRLNVDRAIRACTGLNQTPDFTLAASPASQTVVQASGTSYSVSVTPVNGFTDSVALSASGLPSGAVAGFTPSSISSGSSTMSVTTLSTTPAGSYTVTVTGSGPGGTPSHSTTVTLVVKAAPDFSIAASPSSRSVSQGTGTSYTASVTPLNGFSGSVALGASGLPSGAAATFSPASIASGSSTMTVTTSAVTPTGSYTVTVTGTGPGGTPTHSTTVTLVVTPAATFALSASPATQTIKSGKNATITVNIARTGFTAGVSLAVSGLSTGATGTFAPNPATGNSSTLTIKTAPNAAKGTFNLTITGTGGGLTRTTTATLVVQ